MKLSQTFQQIPVEIPSIFSTVVIKYSRKKIFLNGLYTATTT